MRKLIDGPGGKKISVRTATHYRRALESGSPEPFEGIKQLARAEHLILLLLYLGLGADEMRCRCYGEPSSKFTPERLTIDRVEQQRALCDYLQAILPVDDFARVMATVDQQLPYVPQLFFSSIHLQNTWASANSMVRVHRQVYLLQDDGSPLSAEQLKSMKHVMNAELSRDVAAKLGVCASDLAARGSGWRPSRRIVHRSSCSSALRVSRWMSKSVRSASRTAAAVGGKMAAKTNSRVGGACTSVDDQAEIVRKQKDGQANGRKTISDNAATAAAELEAKRNTEEGYAAGEEEAKGVP